MGRKKTRLLCLDGKLTVFLHSLHFPRTHHYTMPMCHFQIYTHQMPCLKSSILVWTVIKIEENRCVFDVKSCSLRQQEIVGVRWIPGFGKYCRKNDVTQQRFVHGAARQHESHDGLSVNSPITCSIQNMGSSRQGEVCFSHAAPSGYVQISSEFRCISESGALR